MLSIIIDITTENKFNITLKSSIKIQQYTNFINKSVYVKYSEVLSLSFKFKFLS